MILETIFGFVINILKGVFLVIPNLPQLPTEITKLLSEFRSLISGVIGMINILIPLGFAAKLLLIVLVVKNWKHGFKFLMFILKKIPFLSIK